MNGITIKLTKDQVIELTPIWDKLKETDGGAVLAQVSFFQGLRCSVIPADMAAKITAITGATGTDEIAWEVNE